MTLSRRRAISRKRTSRRQLRNKRMSSRFSQRDGVGLEENSSLDLNSFTNVLGSGGFGLIASNPRDPTQVIKLFYTQNSCDAAQFEANLLGRVFVALASVKCGMSQVEVPKPMGFWKDEIAHNGLHFSCAFRMKRVMPPPGFHVLIHIALRSEGELDKEIGRSGAQPIGPANPSRGFFAVPEYLESYLQKVPSQVKGDIHNVHDLAKRCGFLWATIVLVASVAPLDVEFVLGVDGATNELAVWALDFNLATSFTDHEKPQDISKMLVYGSKGVAGAGMDLYVPPGDSPYFDSWRSGALESMACSKYPSSNVKTGLEMALQQLEQE